VNSDTAIVQNNAWKIQKFAILPYDFSVEGGELTPTLKLRRDHVCNMYEGIIDEMYWEEKEARRKSVRSVWMPKQ
jgi:long-subunit acyl-CoA synthetase (AMP-forming)